VASGGSTLGGGGSGAVWMIHTRRRVPGNGKPASHRLPWRLVRVDALTTHETNEGEIRRANQMTAAFEGAILVQSSDIKA